MEPQTDGVTATPTNALTFFIRIQFFNTQTSTNHSIPALIIKLQAIQSSLYCVAIAGLLVALY
jgi:hypothetical protein